MIPYNPSSFDRNKTILEQILELQKWLKEHPSYKVYSTYVHYYPAQNRDIWFNEINGDTDFIDSIAIGDIVVWGDGYYSSVEAVSIDPDDRDNSYVTIAIPVTSLIGPQGPAGTSVTNATVTAGYLALYLSDGSQINCGYVKGADGTNGTNGTNGVDGAYVSTATVDGNGDLQITIYDPATSTSSTINAGHVVGPAGSGIQIVALTSTSGTLSADDLSKVTGTDDCIITYTNAGSTLVFKRSIIDSSNAYFTNVVVDNDTYYLYCEVDVTTGAYNLGTDQLPIKASNVNSETATNGQVLTADGSGGASWQNAGGGGSTKYLHKITLKGKAGKPYSRIYVNIYSSSSASFTSVSDIYTALNSQQSNQFTEAGGCINSGGMQTIVSLQAFSTQFIIGTFNDSSASLTNINIPLTDLEFTSGYPIIEI